MRNLTQHLMKTAMVDSPLSRLKFIWEWVRNLSPMLLFCVALGLSIFVHFSSIIILSLPQTVRFFQKPLKQIEVNYENLKKKEPPKDELQAQKVRVSREKQAMKDIKVFSKESDKLSTFKGDASKVSKFGRRVELDQKHIPAMGTLDMHRSVLVPMLKAEKITNPKYLNYNEKIREKIRQRAFTFVENLEFQSGEVYLTFILLSTGELSQIKIIEAKTKADRQLRDIGVRSIQESNPFPPFPPDLRYPELTFNVVISFEVSE